MTFTIRPLHFPTEEGGTSPNKKNASAKAEDDGKSKKKGVKRGRRGNNSVKFQAGWLSGGGAGSVWDGGKEKLHFPCSRLDKREDSFPKALIENCKPLDK